MAHVSLDKQGLKQFVNDNELGEMQAMVNAADDELRNGTGAGADFRDWLHLPTEYDKDEFARIKAAAKKIQSDSDILVVIGIGGSYLGAQMAIDFLHNTFYQAQSAKDRKYPLVIFAGILTLYAGVILTMYDPELGESLAMMEDAMPELFAAFDMEYEYDIRESFEGYLQGKLPLSAYTDMLNFQEAMYPANYNKLRFLENHDQPRIASVLPDQEALVNYTAMLYFLKGTTLLYAGQEFCDDHLPSLFDKDVFNRNTGRDISALLSRLREIKGGFGSGDSFTASADDDLDLAVMERESEGRRSLGVFSLKGKKGPAALKLKDGDYVNLIDGSTVSIRGGSFFCQGRPVIITV